MPKMLKVFLIALGCLIGAMVIVGGIIAATFNPNDYKPLVIKLVQEKKQRTLTIPGDIKLTFFPKIGADLGQVSLSEYKGKAEFASINNAKVTLELFPLLSKRLIVDRIAIDGMSARITRFKDGTTNFDDLMSKEESGEQIKFDIDSVRVSNAQILLDDQQEMRKLDITGLNINTGKIASGAVSKFDITAHVKNNLPAVDAAVTVKSGFTIDLDKAHYALDGFQAEVKGSFADFIQTTFALQGSVDIKPVVGDNDKLAVTSSQLQVTLEGKQGSQAISGTLTTPLSVNMKTQTVELQAIAAAFTLPDPNGGTFKFKADGRVDIDLDKQTASSKFKGSLDESTFDASLGVAKFSPMAYVFDIGIDRIDADRYQGKQAAGSTKTAPEKPIDLSALKELNAKGNVRIASLKVENLRLSSVRIGINADNGKIDINPVAANLYGGTAAGTISLVASSTPEFALKQNLAGISIGNLLKDAIDKAPIDGKGNVQLDVRSHGATAKQLKKALSGTAKLELRDGAVSGINIAQAIRNAKAKIGTASSGAAPQSGVSSETEKTDFSELNGSFRITNGVAHNDDLDVKSPLFRLGGSGDIDIGDDRLDYLVKATIVPTLQGQGGAELQALKGVTVPVRLSGPFTSIGWKVDFASLVQGLAKGKIDEKKEELKAKVQEKVQDELKDKLKGLFGK